MWILEKKRTAKYTGFHHVMFVSNLTGLDTLTKVYQINWRQPKVALDELVHRNHLMIFFITTFVLFLLLLIDYIYHSRRRRTHSIATNNGLVILLYLNSTALFIAYMAASSSMDQGKESSNKFVRITTVYAIPSFFYVLHFFLSLSCYRNAFGAYEKVEQECQEVEQEIKKLEQRIELIEAEEKKTEKSGCFIM